MIATLPKGHQVSFLQLYATSLPLQFKLLLFWLPVLTKGRQDMGWIGLERSLNQFTWRMVPLLDFFSSLWSFCELLIISPNLYITCSCLLAIYLNKLYPGAVKLHGQSFLAFCVWSPRSRGIASVSHSEDISFINRHMLDYIDRLWLIR